MHTPLSPVDLVACGEALLEALLELCVLGAAVKWPLFGKQPVQLSGLAPSAPARYGGGGSEGRGLTLPLS